MAIWICEKCAGQAENDEKAGKENSFPTHTSLGAMLGAVSGNPVLIAVGAATGAFIDSKNKIADSLGFEAECDLCEQKDQLESCECGRRICLDCRYLLAEREEEAGNYLPYRRDEESLDRGGWSKLTPIKRGSEGIGEGEVKDVVDLNPGRKSSEGGQENGLGWEGAEFSTSEGHKGDFSFGEGLGEFAESGEGNGSGESGSSTGGEGDG